VKLAVAVAAAVCSAGLSGPPLPDGERARVLAAADKYLQRSPATVTSTRAARSAGGRHDFFSEGDYWWPDPKNPSGPYVRRDGESNPDHFVEHRPACNYFTARADNDRAALEPLATLKSYQLR